MGSEDSSSDRWKCDHRCTCGHDRQDHTTSGHCNACDEPCDDDDGHYPNECGYGQGRGLCGCGHREHSSRCREMAMPGPPGDVDECGCLKLTPENELKVGLAHFHSDEERCEDPENCGRWHLERPGQARCGGCTDGSHTPEEHLRAGTEGILHDHGFGAPCINRACQEGRSLGAPDCIRENGCPHLLMDGCERGCRHAADALAQEAQEQGFTRQPQRRLPYAVAYAVGGQEPFELLVPGDATVLAVDGSLVISHGDDSPVQAILQIKPYTPEKADG